MAVVVRVAPLLSGAHREGSSWAAAAAEQLASQTPGSTMGQGEFSEHGLIAEWLHVGCKVIAY